MKDKEKQNISMKEMLTKRSIESITNCNCRQNKEGAFVDLLNQEIEELQKEKQINEMAKEIFNTCAWRFGKPNDYKEIFNDIAEDLIKLNYRKLPKDSVVISKEEYNDLKGLEKKFDDYLIKEIGATRKETAKKILNGMYKEILSIEEIHKEKQSKIYSFNDIDGSVVYKMSVDLNLQFCEYAKGFIQRHAKSLGVEIKE